MLIMELVPESLQGNNTLALDHTFKQRLIGAGPAQLLIDIENERDMVKLGLWLEQFGIPVELLPKDLGEFAFRELLQEVLKIYRLSGTSVSICLLAKALQVIDVSVSRDCYQLCYTGEVCYNGQLRHDAGGEFRTFVVDVHVDGVRPEKKPEFENTFRKLFQVFEPVGLHLRDVNFKGIFDTTFYSIFN